MRGGSGPQVLLTPATSGRALEALLIASDCKTVQSLQTLDKDLFKVQVAKWWKFLGIRPIQAQTQVC